MDDTKKDNSEQSIDYSHEISVPPVRYKRVVVADNREVFAAEVRVEMSASENVDFSDKTVALFGLGDQEEYCDNFLDGMGTLYDKVVEGGATVVGNWSTDGYDHDESTAIRNDEFVGLALDEDNQDELSNERVEKWVEQISPYFLKEVT